MHISPAHLSSASPVVSSSSSSSCDALARLRSHHRRPSLIRCLIIVVCVITFFSIVYVLPPQHQQQILRGGNDGSHSPVVLALSDAQRYCDVHYPPSSRTAFHHLERDADIGKFRDDATADSRHEHFLVLFRAYAKFHRCMLEHQRASGHQSLADLPLLVVNLPNGLGNKLRGLASALLSALLTKRVLLTTGWLHVCPTCDFAFVFQSPPPIVDLVMDRAAMETLTMKLARWRDGFYRWYHRFDTTTADVRFNFEEAVTPFGMNGNTKKVVHWDTYDFIVPQLLRRARERLQSLYSSADMRRVVELLDPRDLREQRSAELFFHHMTRWLTVPVVEAQEQAARFINETFFMDSSSSSSSSSSRGSQRSHTASAAASSFACTVGVHIRRHGEISGNSLWRWRLQHTSSMGYPDDAWTYVATQWQKSAVAAAQRNNKKKQKSGSSSDGDHDAESRTPSTCKEGLRFVAACDLCDDGARRVISVQGLKPVVWLPGNDNTTERSERGGTMRALVAMLVLNAMPALIGTTNSTFSWVAGHAGWRSGVVNRTAFVDGKKKSWDAPTEVVRSKTGDKECQLERVVSCFAHEKGY